VLGGITIADGDSHPPNYYFPTADIRPDELEQVERDTT
jgi:uncharacterized protein (DUF427 family)